jgi:uncharacterized protein (DUF1697 family)
LSVYIALLRGINVGRAKRVAMADLRALMAGMGYLEVRTLLNSGNVVFEAPRVNAATLSAAIHSGFARQFGFSASVTVISAADLNKIVGENPLLALARDPSRHLIGFTDDPKVLVPFKALLKQKWHPDALAITPRAAYLWCVKGVLDSPLSQAFGKLAGEGITTRNWATVLKIQAVALSPRMPS